MGLITPITLPTTAELGPVHFIAIGGSGMNGIASVMAAAGLPVKYLDSVNYPRLLLYTTTPPPVPTPTPEGSWVVFLGPFPTQADADVQCPPIVEAQPGAICVTGQADPP